MSVASGGSLAQVVGGVVAHDVHDRRPGPAGVVQVGDPVAEARPQVQQRGRRATRHPAVAVGRPGDDSLEEPEDGPHLGHVVEGGDEMHLRRPRVHEADVTSHATSVRMRAWAPFIVGRLSSVEEYVRSEDPVRVEGVFDPPHQGHLGGVLELLEIPLLRRPDAVLARDGPAEVHPRPEDGPQDVRPSSRRSGWKTERWTLPSPTCPHPVTSVRVGVGHLGRPWPGRRGWRPGAPPRR